MRTSVSIRPGPMGLSRTPKTYRWAIIDAISSAACTFCAMLSVICPWSKSSAQLILSTSAQQIEQLLSDSHPIRRLPICAVCRYPADVQWKAKR